MIKYLKDDFFSLSAVDSKHVNALRLILYIVWACVVLYLVSHHEFWRDEVRTLSFALQGSNVIEMWQGVHGEGHPILWYLHLRFALAIWNTPQVLPVVAFIVAAMSALLLVRKSPFGLLFIALILFSKFGIYEYAVMARNYGISMLLLFMLATCYKKHRHQGVVLGGLLFLLANCNPHSVILVACFLMFWFLDSIFNKNIEQNKFLKIFLLNTFIAILGVLVCFFTIYPTFNDAARMGSGMPDVITLKLLLNAIVFPGFVFYHPYSDSLLELPQVAYFKWPATILLYGSPLVLIKRPAAMVATWAALIMLALFFVAVFPGAYRHEVLWIVFFISMYWICCDDENQAQLSYPLKLYAVLNVDFIKNIGYFLLIVLMVIQTGLGNTAWRIKTDKPDSCSKALASFISKNPELKNAILVAEEDYMLEPLPYYIKNPIYLIHEQKFGRITHFTTKARVDLTLEDILNSASDLKKDSNKPVIILLSHKLNHTVPTTIKEGYNWTLTTTPDQVKKFLDTTRFLAYFGPAISNESYDAYLLK